jgi:hypothetical protein
MDRKKARSRGEASASLSRFTQIATGPQKSIDGREHHPKCLCKHSAVIVKAARSRRRLSHHGHETIARAQRWSSKLNRVITMDVQSAAAAFCAATLFFATIVIIGAKLPRLKGKGQGQIW